MLGIDTRIRRMFRSVPGRAAAVLFLLLTPGALFLAIHLELNNYESDAFSIRVNRQGVVDAASAFVREQGFALPAAAPSLRMEKNVELLRYLHRRAIERRSPLLEGRLPLPPAAISVHFAVGATESYEVTVSPSGDIVGFSMPPSLNTGGAAASAENAIAAAQAPLGRVLGDAGAFSLSTPRVYGQTGGAGQALYRVEWTATSRQQPELSFTARFGVAGDRVFSQEITADVDDGYMAGGGIAFAARSALTSIAPFYIFALILYTLIRYIQRSLEKEVSHGRALVLALYIIAMVGVIFLSGDEGILLNVEASSDASDAVYILIFFFLGMVALMGGAAYASCEGDVRESFPRSLTSFDALVTGRVFSRNVARAFLLGFVASCWLFLIQVLANLQFEGGIQEPNQILAVYGLVSSRAPFAVVFLMLPLLIGFVVLFGLLVPLSIVSRLRRFRNVAWILLGLLMFTNLALIHGGFASAGGFLTIVGAEAVAMLILFLAADLLTAYVALVLTAYVALLTDAQMLTVLPPQIQWYMHGVVSITLAAALLLLWKGKENTDAEVRPAYARALAERQKLDAEVATASLAQAQMQTREMPVLAGISIAAECKPARTVSGDFYDGYALGPRRTALLLISGAGRGLLDAMVIAFTKGFMLERVHSSRSPHETMADLLMNMAPLLDPADTFPELCYLLVDAEDRRLSYSRTAEFPGLVSIRQSDSGVPSVRESATAELVAARRIEDRPIQLRNGSISLDPGTTVLVYTCGFERHMELSGVWDLREWLRTKWEDVAASEASAVLRRLAEIAFGQGYGWQNATPRDDVTLLVLHASGVHTEEADVAA